MSEALKNKRKSLIEQLNRVAEFVNDDEQLAGASIESLNFRLKNLERIGASFESVQGKLEEKFYDDTVAAQRKVFEDIYYTICPRVMSMIRAREIAERPRQSTARDQSMLGNNGSNSVRLPKLSIPIFSGDVTKWRAFMESFDSLIDTDTSLSGSTKFQYLKCYLAGPAAKVIEALEINDDNYDIACELLRNRFNNQRLIVHEHIKEMFDLPVVNNNSASDLRNIVDSVNANMRALETLGRSTGHWDDVIVYLITSKLDFESLSKWQESIASTQPPTLSQLMKFIDRRSQVLESASILPMKVPNQIPSKQQKSKQCSLTSSSADNKGSGKQCSYCDKSGHFIYRCYQFKKLSILDRISEARKRKICVNCLRPGHFADNCPSNPCKLCSAKHNVLLHLPATSANEKALPSASTPFQNANSSIHNVNINAPSSGHSNINSSLQSSAQNSKHVADYIFLATAKVDVVGGQSIIPVTCRVLLDSGSQLSFVTERLANELGLHRSKADVCVSGVGGAETQVKYKTMITIKSKINHFETTIEACVLPKITGFQPYRFVDISDWIIPKNIRLADPQFNRPEGIDVLIGADVYYNLLSVGQICGSDRYPTLQNTVFGYVVSGKKSTDYGSATYQCNFATESKVPLERQIEQFWQLEQVPALVKSKSQEDEACERHFTENVSRSVDGRYIVALPFRDDAASLGNSMQMARQRFYNIERKLQRDNELKVEYSKFMSDYLRLGHMEEIHESMVPKINYFMPHHCVIKPDSSSTRLRVVFDASAKSTTGKSLNELLMVGPTVQSDLFSIILRFRLWRYVFSTDITKMYRQIQIRDDDKRFQCVFWRNDPVEALRIFQLKTVTYGTSTAPFLATRVLKQLADDYVHEFPLACEAINRCCYVDDVMAGCNSLDQALILQNQLITLFKLGRFDLKKWCANHQYLLNKFDSGDLQKQTTIRDNDVIKTLGLIWEPKNDRFLISIQTKINKRITKRTILADTMRIFDPLGLIAPIVVGAKIFIQQLWKLNLSWDESLPQSLFTMWSEFKNQLDSLNILKFDRHSVIEDPVSIELHAFADASERAYGCCIYLRSIDSSSSIKTSLFCAKSRVAPTKSVSLPRMELCAAQLCAQLVHRVLEIVSGDIKIDRLYYWCDSTIVLSWISSPAYQWKTFVANRVANIQEISDPNDWHHVRTKQNPADLVSRGTTPDGLCNSELWFKGPEFLMNKCIVSSKVPLNINDVPEKKTEKISLVSSNIEKDIIESLKFHNSYLKTLRIIAYCRRFILAVTKKSQPPSSNTITADEYESSLITCVKIVQKGHYGQELKSLLGDGSVSTRSKILSLTPFIDDSKVIRVGGRLQNSVMPFRSKHPIVVPKNHPFTIAIINHYHLKYFHAGPQALLAAVRQTFWPVNGKELTRKIVRKCIRCYRSKPATITQLMGNLPSQRLVPGRPFLTVGIDFMGPIEIHYKIRGKKPTKAYVAVFICFTTKAVHLEVVSDLSSEACLASLKRFVGRRGKPNAIYTDNATNFVCARNDFAEFMQNFLSNSTQTMISQMCAEDGIRWCTIPPRSPHFGGLWEAAVKSAKTLLRRQLGFASLTFEELTTVLVQIEAILNSRPLTPLSSDPGDLQALTPGHFLIGSPLTAIVEPNIADHNINRLTRWRHITWLHQQFWQRWSREYLHTLQARSKWCKVKNEIKVNDLILLQEDNVPPLKWPLARVVELHTGRDGLTRVATVKTSTGLFKRAITRMAPLPLADEF